MTETDGTSKRKRRRKTGPRKNPISEKKFLEAVNLYMSGGHTQTECAEMLKVSLTCFRLWVNKYWENGYSLDGLTFVKQRKSRSKDGKSGTN